MYKKAARAIRLSNEVSDTAVRYYTILGIDEESLNTSHGNSQNQGHCATKIHFADN